MGKAERIALLFEGQDRHFGLLLILLILLIPVWRHPLMGVGELWGLTSRELFVVVIANAVAHQVYVWLCWRLQLHYNILSRVFGKYAFEVYATPFFLMLSLRPVLAFALAISNQGTVAIPHVISTGVSVLLAVPLMYLGYSIRRYFGFARAAGADHFYESYRTKPMVREGIFRYSPNSMYAFGFLMLWIPAVYFASFAALAAAGFSHLYIWVHYLATERPDMRRIYGS